MSKRQRTGSRSFECPQTPYRGRFSRSCTAGIRTGEHPRCTQTRWPSAVGCRTPRKSNSSIYFKPTELWKQMPAWTILSECQLGIQTATLSNYYSPAALGPSGQGKRSTEQRWWNSHRQQSLSTCPIGTWPQSQRILSAWLPSRWHWWRCGPGPKCWPASLFRFLRPAFSNFSALRLLLSRNNKF